MSSNDATQKILIVALGVCLVCSVLVATAAVSLRARQERNKELDKVKNILQAGDLPTRGVDVLEVFREQVRTVVVDLENGESLTPEQYPKGFNPETFQIKEAADSRVWGRAIPAEKDIIHVQRMPRYMTVYEIIHDGRIVKLILPIYGKGLWSTLYGFIALGENLSTVKGITFYEHGETPGLGGEVDNPGWKASWKGKEAFAADGRLALEVIKGKVDTREPGAVHQIDGLSGSTLTTRGLDAIIKFWLSEAGYGRFLNSLKERVPHEG